MIRKRLNEKGLKRYEELKKIYSKITGWENNEFIEEDIDNCIKLWVEFFEKDIDAFDAAIIAINYILDGGKNGYGIQRILEALSFYIPSPCYNFCIVSRSIGIGPSYNSTIKNLRKWIPKLHKFIVLNWKEIMEVIS